MSEQFIYKSVFAPYFNSFLEMKKTMGFGLTKIQWVFLEFDKFFMETGATTVHITREQIIAWSKSRINNKDRTMYDKYSIMRQLCVYLCHLGYECYIPRMPRPKWPDYVPYVFTHDQMESIFKKCDGLIMANRSMNSILFSIPALFRFLYSTGVRISEALSIKNEDVNFERQRIVLRKTKNRMERLVPIHPSLLEVLVEYKQHRDKIPIQGLSAPNGFFFISTSGKALQRHRVYVWFRKILKKCELPHLSNHCGPHVHNIRHTAAVHSLIKQVGEGTDIYCSLPILSVFLGHKTLQGTEKYVRLTQEMYPEVIKMEQVITSFIYPKIEIDYDND